MTRALHRCLGCEPLQPTPKVPFVLRRGFTRHDDRVCSKCRHAGIRVVDGQVLVPLRPMVVVGPTRQWRLLERVADPAAGPTLSELKAGIDITGYISPDADLGWHGTDCGCATCVADRIPGRYA